MEINGTQTALNFDEARWIARYSFMPADLRREAERGRRRVLGPYVDPALLDVPEPGDVYSDTDILKRVWLEFALRDAERQFQDSTGQSPTVSVRLGYGALYHLYSKARAAHDHALERTGGFEKPAHELRQELDGLAREEDEGEDEAGYEMQRDIEEILATGSIIAAYRETFFNSNN